MPAIVYDNVTDPSIIQGVLTPSQFIAGYRNVQATNVPAVVNFDLNSGVPTITAQLPGLSPGDPPRFISTIVNGGAGTGANLPVVIPSLIGDGVTDNTAQFNATIGYGGTFPSSGYTAAGIQQLGTYIAGTSGPINWHPQISYLGAGRGSVILECAPNMAATTPGSPGGPSGNPTGGGAPNSLIRVVATAPPVTGTLSSATFFMGLSLIGNKTNQTNAVHGFRKPNPDPSKNNNDGSSTFDSKKDYTGLKIFHTEITNFSGDGCVGEAGNGRSFYFDTRSLNNGGNGFTQSGDDVIFGHRSAAGGNAGNGFQTGFGSGYFFNGLNGWGNNNLRSNTCAAIFINNSKRWCIVGPSEWNDWWRISGQLDKADGNNECFYRGGMGIGNLITFFDQNYSSDGVLYDATTPSPLPQLQSYIYMEQYVGSFFALQHFVRSTPTSFNTPYNTSIDSNGHTQTGYTNGLYGTGAAYLYYIDNGGEAAIIQPYSSAPNVKPFVNTNPATASYNDPVPIATHNQGAATYYIIDTYVDMHRFGARGSGRNCRVLLAINESNNFNPAYNVEVGALANRIMLYGGVDHQQAPQYVGIAVNNHNVVNNGDTVTVKPGQKFQNITNVHNTPNPSFTLVLPQGQSASYFWCIEWVGAGWVNYVVTGNLSADVPYIAVTGTYVWWLYYDPGTDVHYVIDTSEPYPGMNDAFFTPTVVAGAVNLNQTVPSLNYDIVVTAPITISCATGGISPAAGYKDSGLYKLLVEQDATGGHTVTWDTSFFSFPNATPIAVDTTALKVSMFLFVWSQRLQKMFYVASGIKE